MKANWPFNGAGVYTRDANQSVQTGLLPRELCALPAVGLQVPESQITLNSDQRHVESDPEKCQHGPIETSGHVEQAADSLIVQIKTFWKDLKECDDF